MPLVRFALLRLTPRWHTYNVGPLEEAMMIIVGKTDAFERKYMGKFRHFAGQFGEFVNYENDRGARDIGLHLTHRLQSGKGG